MRSFRLTAFILFVLFTGGGAATRLAPWNDARADAHSTRACELPVCDIPGKIAELRAASQATRYATMNQLRNAHKKTLDIAVQLNLREFALAARALYEELQEEDWVIGSASNLADQASVILAQIQPLNGANLFKLYKETASNDPKIQILNYWNPKVKSMNDLSELQELMIFCKQIIASANEDTWEALTQTANQILSQITSRVSFLDPFHEGIYEISLACSTQFNKELCESINLEKYGMVVLNGAGSAAGLTTSILAQSTGDLFAIYYDVLFSFDTMTLEGETPTTINPASYFKVVLNRTTSEVKGWVRNTRLPESLLVSGKIVRSPAEFMKDSGPPSVLKPEEIEGTYEGTWGEMQGIMIIKQVKKNRFAASFYSKKDLKLVKEYTFGDFQANRGLLTLMAPTGNNLTKLILAYRTDQANPGKVTLKGFSFSNGEAKASDAKLVKSGDVTQPPSTQSQIVSQTR